MHRRVPLIWRDGGGAPQATAEELRPGGLVQDERAGMLCGSGGGSGGSAAAAGSCTRLAVALGCPLTSSPCCPRDGPALRAAAEPGWEAIAEQTGLSADMSSLGQPVQQGWLGVEQGQSVSGAAVVLRHALTSEQPLLVIKEQKKWHSFMVVGSSSQDEHAQNEMTQAEAQNETQAEAVKGDERCRCLHGRRTRGLVPCCG